MKKSLYETASRRALEHLEKAGIVLSESEKQKIEVADYDLNDHENIGLQILTYVNTERCCAKELVLFPYQTCPEHIHAPVGDYEGKEETFRCRAGKVYLYVEGEPSADIHARIQPEYKSYYTVFHEIELNPGDQHTLYPNTKHWFQAAGEGAVVSEFSTKSLDEHDIFTDPNIVRIPMIED